MNNPVEEALPDILIIDDDSTVVITLHKVLCHIGRIRFASDATQAFEMINEAKPNLILLDVELPDMNGLEVCTKLKSNHETKGIPVLFITSNIETGFEEKVFDAGASDYIVKPLKPRVVAARVQTHLAYHRAMEQLNKLAHTDSLSNLANRLTFDEQLDLEFRRAKRQHEPLTLVLIDIDEFKKYNDHFGHLAGDECIRNIGHILSSITKRPADLAARYGGEEFALILPNTQAPGVKVILKELINRVEQSSIHHAPNAMHSVVTISAGYTTLAAEECEQNLTATDLLQAADKALYISKHNGRNRCTFESLSQAYH
ncbi:GGDEF domain-containing response regulator [Shewanella acanthi]|uniref:GGDEF domain-containing response regulator n=1 Tax=Shewanella acanthi TaxID=2864212 RepID=UPI001C6615E5|nr:diguanylate cyclase [Shewanella acanthi]QYJ77461.1 diguanylate cyclase [Shewanella acanthi]